jgi:hypothetical protein
LYLHPPAEPPLRTNIPNLDAEDIELDALIGERLVAESLAGFADAFFEAGVHPEAVAAVSAW